MVNIASYRTGSSIRLYPWKDGMKILLTMLGDERQQQQSYSSYQNSSASTSTSSGSIRGDFRIKTVFLLFEEPPSNENDNSSNKMKQQANQVDDLCLEEEQYMTLFDFIANGLPNLESVIIRKDSNYAPPQNKKHHSIGAVPPIQALTSLLRGENSMQYMTLIGLDLIGDTFDVKGLVESIRIHRGLHSIVMKNCYFENENHISLIRDAIYARGVVMKHKEFIENKVKQPNKRWWFCGWCTTSIVVGVSAILLVLLYENNNMIFSNLSSSMETINDSFSSILPASWDDVKQRNKGG